MKNSEDLLDKRLAVCGGVNLAYLQTLFPKALIEPCMDIFLRDGPTPANSSKFAVDVINKSSGATYPNMPDGYKRFVWVGVVFVNYYNECRFYYRNGLYVDNAGAFQMAPALIVFDEITAIASGSINRFTFIGWKIDRKPEIAI